MVRNVRDQSVTASEVLQAAGVSTLGDDPPPDAVFHALERLGGLLSGGDPLLREACRSAAVVMLKLTGVHGPGRVETVERVEGRAMWPRAVLPWGVADAEEVESGLSLGAKPPLFGLWSLYQRRVVLPEPKGHWAALLAAWTLGTYLLDRFAYYPILLLEGPPERGKTRLGKALIWTAMRGMFTPSPAPATIFRDRARHRVSILLDVGDLPGLMQRNGDIADLLLNSFERDGVIRRVTRPDAPPQEQVESFAAYGATVVATNTPLAEDSALASRCIRVPLPEAGSVIVTPALRPDEALRFRAHALTWAAQTVADGGGRMAAGDEADLFADGVAVLGGLHDGCGVDRRVARLDCEG